MARIGNPLPLSATGLNIGGEISVLKTSDGLDWPNLNVTLMGCKPYDRELVHQSSDDLWVSMTMDPLDMSFLLEGEERCSMLLPGRLNLIPPRTVVGTRRRNDAPCLHAFLKGEIVAEVAGEIFDRDAADTDFAPAFSFESPGMASMLWLLNHALFEPGEHSALKIEYLSRGLVADILARTLPPARDRRAAHAGDRLTARQARQVTNYIHDHLSSGISLSEMAAAAGLGRTLFIQRFKTTFGRTPHQYAIEARIRRARELLARPELSLVEVALACGFADQAHFCARFKRTMGTTPLAFRRQNA